MNIDMTNFTLILCTAPDYDSAEEIAVALVDSELAGCVNLVPQVQSIYRWQGSIKRQSETMIYIKSTPNHYAQIEAIICEHHPYDIPEIIACPISRGLPEYLSWLRDTVLLD